MPEEHEGEYVKFFPYQLMLEVTALVVIAGILLMASSFPAELGAQYDPMNPPKHLMPEWYFMPIYQVLKSEGLGEPFYGLVILTAIVVGLITLPFIDRSDVRHPLRRTGVVTAGVFLGAELVMLTYLGFNISPQELKAWQLGLLTLINLLAAIVLVRITKALYFR